MPGKDTRTSHNLGPVETKSIAPGGVVGILGGGQLGRMFGIAARRMGYSVHAFEPTSDSPAGQISDVEINAPYDDYEALTHFAREVEVVTFEFENIPRAAIEAVHATRPVRPQANVLHVCQNREREKNFLCEHGFPLAPFAVVDSLDCLRAAIDHIGLPAVLKIADFGYDGKGQVKITAAEDIPGVWERFGVFRAVLEKWIPFKGELSVVVARGLDGQTAPFSPSENIHTNHILDVSIVPARYSDAVLSRAKEIAEGIARDLDVVGLLAVEFFVTQDDELLVNELAPRPHNSGHYTFDACVTSQFEQQLRAVCGLPLGATDMLAPVVMWNLLGDLWENGEPDWSVILAEPRAKLHLYGKSEARRGRKMGHVCVLADIEEALEIIQGFKAKLQPS